MAGYQRADGGGLETALRGDAAIANETGGASVLASQDAAAAVVDGKPTTKEHFGFTDGFGNPDYLGVERSSQPGQGKLMPDGSWAPLATGELLLGYADEAASCPLRRCRICWPATARSWCIASCTRMSRRFARTSMSRPLVWRRQREAGGQVYRAMAGWNAAGAFAGRADPSIVAGPARRHEFYLWQPIRAARGARWARTSAGFIREMLSGLTAS